MTDAVQAQDATEPTEPATVQDTPADAATGAANTVDQLPEWAQSLVKDLRSENAKHRTAAKDAAKAAEEAARKQAEEQGEYKRLYEEQLQKAQDAEARAKAAELARIKGEIAAKYSMPAALVDRLRGETLEELEADALALMEALPKPQPTTRTDSTAGVNGKTPTPEPSDRELQELAAVYGVSVEALKRSIQNQN